MISTENGGAVTLIKQGENGYVLDGFDIMQWVEKIQSLMDNKEKWMEMGDMAEKTVKEKYLWDKLADQFLSAYQEALEL